MSRPDSTLPLWAERLLVHLASAHNREVVVGDFAELFAWRTEESGRSRALLWFWGQVLKSLPAFISNGFTFGGAMLKNYATVAVRNLRKRRFYTAINVGGLAVGMAACLLIFQYVTFEQSYDAFHADADRLYRMINISERPNGTFVEPFTWANIGPEAVESVSGVEAYARYHPNYGTATIAVLEDSTRGAAFREDAAAFVDPAFLSMFSFPLVRGDAATVLTEPETILLSASTAERYFGEADPIGRTLQVDSWSDGVYTVVGVFADSPPNSHLQFDVLMPLADLTESGVGQYAESDGWDWTNFITYLLLLPGADVAAVEAATTRLLETQFSEDLAAEGSTLDISLQPVRDIHLRSDFDIEHSEVSSARTVYFFTIVALFILVIAWVNTINLSTARAMERAREVGVRKAIGAYRKQVVAQFLTESALVNGLALVLAVGLAFLALPLLNDLGGVEITTSVWREPKLWGGFIVVFGVGALLSSLYPAFVLSAFEPVAVLKGTLGRFGSHEGLRKVLVVFQFAASIALLIGTYAVYQQVDFMRSQSGGLDLDQVLVVDRPRFAGEDYRETREVFKEALLQQAAISSVATSAGVPGQGHNLGTSGRREGAPGTDEQMLNMSWVNEAFLETYGMTLIAGRNFDADLETDREAVLINETAVQAFGFDSPEAALGQGVLLGGGSDNRLVVIGVVEDYHWLSLKEQVPPTLLALTSGGGYFSLRTGTADLDATLATVRATFDEIFPGNPFHYFFADQHFDKQYREDVRFGMLFGLFAGFALLVACLGLVGLAAYTASQRTKEIGVRKVLGAGAGQIVRLLVTDFAKLIGVAFVLTVPLMVWGLKVWLDGFATHIDVRPALFIVPALVVLSFALLTVSYHTLRAALADPVRSLRYD